MTRIQVELGYFLFDFLLYNYYEMNHTFSSTVRININTHQFSHMYYDAGGVVEFH